MNHQSQLEKPKYRNWVRGGLAYKYLKEGIEGFTDDVVLQEHGRILKVVKQTHGLTCNQCCLRNLRPSHTCKKGHAGRKKCPWDQSHCNCLYPNKKPCPNNVCDTIREEILKSHGSAPPTPNWKNTDVQKWCSAPWEIAKCFINAPGYSDKTKAGDIDTAGLLHVFINNINLHSHLDCSVTGTNSIFAKTRERRNTLFHSLTMEMDDAALTECINDIIAILEDSKELKARPDAQKAVIKLKQLEQEDFIITTHSEAEVCRDALASITAQSEELKQTILEARDDIGKKQTEATDAIGEKANEALQELDNHNKLLHEKVEQLESEISTMKQRLSSLESKVENLEVVRQYRQKHLEYVQGKEALRKKLTELYKSHYVRTSVSPLKQQENDTNITEVYVAPKLVVKEKKDPSTSSPIEKAPHKINTKTVNRYQEILQTNGQRHTKVFIVGDVGTGKSTFCKMMIQNWCSAVSEDVPMRASNDKLKDPDTSATNDYDQLRAVEVDNINEMRNFDFLFFVSLQRMSGLNDITAMIKAIITDADLASNDLIDRIFELESERCIIIVDGLDEWAPPKEPGILPHVSYGLPERDKARRATVVTISRPSAKGILNMKSSECDKKAELLGIDSESVKCFIKKYMTKINNTCLSYDDFLEKIQLAKLDHLEKTPLLLQQLVWLYSIGNEIGKSISDTYSHLVNIMLGWSQNKEEGEHTNVDTYVSDKYKDMKLPRLLQRFPRCNENKSFLFPLARIAFEALTSETVPSTFSRAHLQNSGVSNNVIAPLTKMGILVENNCFDPTQANTMLEFIHISYLEFFAAVYVSSMYPASVLHKLFQKRKCCADVLQLSNVFKMTCGLCPFIISELSNLVSDIVNRDERMARYRKTLASTTPPYVNITIQIQSLIFNCLSECDSCDLGDQPIVSLCDIIIDSSDEHSSLQRIIPEKVISLNVFNSSDIKVWRWITRLKQVQYVHIDSCAVTQREMELFSSCVQDAPLRLLSLYNLDGGSHTIDLSKHDQLQKLFVVYASVTIPNVNTTHLESLCLDENSFNVLGINCLTDARCLKQLSLVDLDEVGTYYYNKEVDSVVHTLQQLQKLVLRGVVIRDNAITVTPEMKNLINIDLCFVEMSLETWRRFVDSLLTLQQSIEVDYTEDFRLQRDKQDYVKRNKKFEVIKSGNTQTFTFGTKK